MTDASDERAIPAWRHLASAMNIAYYVPMITARHAEKHLSGLRQTSDYLYFHAVDVCGSVEEVVCELDLSGMKNEGRL